MPVEQTLLLFLRLLGESGRAGKVALPITATSLVDTLVEGTGLEVVRTAHSLADLTKSSAEEGVVFAGAIGGGYVFPGFLPAYDAVAALCNLLQLLAPVKRPLSELVAELPVSTLVHRQLPCPWALKGVVMRVLNEQLADRRARPARRDQGLRRARLVQVLPDPDEPLLHLYAEGRDDEDDGGARGRAARARGGDRPGRRGRSPQRET